MFLELWKRRQSVLQWQWDLENYEEEEEVRPEFQARVKTTRVNPVTKKIEPYIPLYNRITRRVTINGLVLCMVSSYLDYCTLIDISLINILLCVFIILMAKIKSKFKKFNVTYFFPVNFY